MNATGVLLWVCRAQAAPHPGVRLPVYARGCIRLAPRPHQHRNVSSVDVDTVHPLEFWSSAIYIHIYTIYIHIYTHTYIYVYKYIHTYIYVCIYICFYMYTYVHTHVYMRVYIHVTERNTQSSHVLPSVQAVTAILLRSHGAPRRGAR